MADLRDVKTWFERDIRFANWERDVEVTEDSPERFHFRIYTDNNVYGIGASTRDGRPSYLGCIACSRKARAGELGARGSDLPDGDFSEETWRHILFAIVGYELVKIHRFKGTPVPMQPDSMYPPMDTIPGTPSNQAQSACQPVEPVVP